MGPTDFRWQELATEAKVRPPHIFMLWHWLSAGAPVEHFAKFAGLEDRHVASMMAALEAHHLVPKRRVPRQGGEKGTRLPAVFQAPQEWIDYAQTKRRWTLTEVHEELDRFTDYWHARAGAGGVKADWLATWRNWCRNSTRPDGLWSAPREGVEALSWNEQCELAAVNWERMDNAAEASKWRAKKRLHAD